MGRELKSLWALNFQFFLSGNALVEGSHVEISDEVIPVQKELNFLGMKIRRCADQGIFATPDTLVGSRIEQERVVAHERITLAPQHPGGNCEAHGP